MEKYEYIPGKSSFSKDAAIALGLFDGIHKGHRYLLEKAKNLAEKNGLAFTVFTFRSEGNFFKGSPPIYSTEDKLYLLESFGVEAVILADFDKISGISAEDFIYSSLIQDMNCKAAIFGEDFRFGNKASGNADMLDLALKKRGLISLIVDEQTENGKKISTSLIKELLISGDVKAAAHLLGMPYFIKSQVSHGEGLGKALGFPTVNISLQNSPLQIKHGVYSSAVLIGKEFHTGITNIGVCPTFNTREPHSETYIIDYSGNLYEKEITVFLLDFIREEKRFKDANELVCQIKKDEEKAKKDWMKTWQEIGLN